MSNFYKLNSNKYKARELSRKLCVFPLKNKLESPYNLSNRIKLSEYIEDNLMLGYDSAYLLNYNALFN